MCSDQGMKKTLPKAHPCEILETQKKEKIVKKPQRGKPYDGLRIRVALGFSKTRRQWSNAFKILRDNYVQLELYAQPNIKHEGGIKL